MLPFPVYIIASLHSGCVLLDELEEHGHIVDLEVAAKDSLLGTELLLLPRSPSLQQELTLVPDLHVAELVSNITLHPSGSYCRLQGLAAQRRLAVKRASGECSQGQF